MYFQHGRCREYIQTERDRKQTEVLFVVTECVPRRPLCQTCWNSRNFLCTVGQKMRLHLVFNQTWVFIFKTRINFSFSFHQNGIIWRVVLNLWLSFDCKFLSNFNNWSLKCIPLENLKTSWFLPLPPLLWFKYDSKMFPMLLPFCGLQDIVFL